MEGTGEILGHDGGQTETERLKPALPGAHLQAGTTVAKAARVITKDFDQPLRHRPGCYEEVRATVAITAATRNSFLGTAPLAKTMAGSVRKGASRIWRR